MLISVNGNGNGEYGTRVALDTGTLATTGLAIVAAPGVTADLGTSLRFDFPGATNQLQNGAPDAVVLFDETDGVLIDALVHEGTMRTVTVDGTVYDLSALGQSSTDIDASLADSKCREWQPLPHPEWPG